MFTYSNHREAPFSNDNIEKWIYYIEQIVSKKIALTELIQLIQNN